MKILHLSDIHCGWPFVPEAADGIVRAAREIAPDAVIVSGDLVQRGDFRDQWKAARAFLDRLPAPRVVIPGNHDMPLWNPLLRALAPFAHFRRYIDRELDPVLHLDGVTIVGLNTARPWVLDLGFLARRQIERARDAFSRARPGALRIAAMHHPVIPQRETGFFRHHVYGHLRAMRGLAAAGADVILSGHNHFPRAELLSRHMADGGSILFAQAGTATSSRVRPERGCASQAFNLIHARDATLLVEPWLFSNGEFVPSETKSFDRKPAPALHPQVESR